VLYVFILSVYLINNDVYNNGEPFSPKHVEAPDRRIGDNSEIFVPNVGFGVGQFNGVIQTCSRATPVANGNENLAV